MKSTASVIGRQNFRRENSGSSWTDGLLLGNGSLGAVAFGSYAMEWILNKSDIYQNLPRDPECLSHRAVMEKIRSMPRKNTMFLKDNEKGAPPLYTVSAAHLRLKTFEGFGWFCSAVPAMPQDLSLYDGELKSFMRKASMKIEALSFLPCGRNVLCIRAVDSHEFGKRRSFCWELLRPADERLAPPVWAEGEADELLFLQSLPDGEGHYAVMLKVLPHDGVRAVLSRKGKSYAILRNAGGVDAFLAVRSSLECPDPLEAVRSDIAECAKEGLDALRRKNRRWWHSFWSRSWADFTSEPEIGKNWAFSLYELACTFGKAPMAGLNGLSYGPVDVISPGLGSPYYTHDQNIQISMMPFPMVNHCEFLSAMADTYLNALEQLRARTRLLFGGDGVCLPLCMLPGGREVPVAGYRYTLCGSAYSGSVLASAWRYSRDESFLRAKIYPLLKEFIRFYLSIMHKGEDGRYHLDWSVPPEIFTMTRDDVCTLSLLRPCLETAVEASQLLHADEAECHVWEDVLAHYPSFARHAEGAWWCGPDIPMGHSMYGGHLLYPFFPSEADLDAETAAKTLEYCGKYALERSFADRGGAFHYVYEWAAFNIAAARLRLEGPSAWKHLERFLEHFGKPNGLFTHNSILLMDPEEADRNVHDSPSVTLENPTGERVELSAAARSGQDATPNPDAKRIAPPVQEGSSAFLFLATETLLQSWGGLIRLFPCVPDGFSGEFHNFLAQGGFEVSAKMKNGTVTFCSVKALRGGGFRLACRGRTEIFQASLRRGETWRFLRPVGGETCKIS